MLVFIFNTPSFGMGMGWGGDDPAEFVSEVVDKIGRFARPSHIKLKGDQLYISDTSEGVIAVYDTAGRLIRPVTDCGSPLGLDVEYVEVTTAELPSMPIMTLQAPTRITAAR